MPRTLTRPRIPAAWRDRYRAEEVLHYTGPAGAERVNPWDPDGEALLSGRQATPPDALVPASGRSGMVQTAVDHLRNTRLSSHQDTLSLRGRAPFATARPRLDWCLVEGDVEPSLRACSVRRAGFSAPPPAVVAIGGAGLRDIDPQEPFLGEGCLLTQARDA